MNIYLLIADALLFLHVLVVVYVVFGLVLIIIGKYKSWDWVRNFWFRITHLAAITVVIIQALFGRICPLTTWEMDLRRKAGDVVYEGSFISHWLGEFIYYDFPLWVFAIGYSIFGALVVISWFWVKPNRFR